MAVRPTVGYTTPERATAYAGAPVIASLRRVSWGAIIAGAIIALVTMFALYMLGLAIGAATINPAQEIDPVDPALGTGTVIWLAASTLIGLFLGGFTAGRMSGVPNDEDGVLHGLVTWAVVTAFTLMLLTTSIGNIINGVTNAFSTVVSSAAEVAPEVAQALVVQDDALLAIQNETRALFAAAAPTTDENGQTLATDAPLTLEQFQLNREIRAFLSRNPDEITEADRDALANALAERTNMTPQMAREQVDRWEAVYVEVREDAERLAREAAQTITDVTAVLAGAIFAAMVAGAFAAGAGGYVGTENFKREVGIDEDSPTGVPPR